MRLFALVGRPVGHSLSPEIHNPLFRAHDIDAAYILVEPPPSAELAIGPLITQLELAGANLTVPFKQEVLAHLARISPVARAIGAVNVVVRDGRDLIGDNTDAPGFVAGLIDDQGAVPSGEVVVLGAGGAGRAVAAGLADHGAERVHLLNRDPARAARVASDLSAHFPTTSFRAAPLDAESFQRSSTAAGVVVNCTSGPATERVAALPLHVLPDTAVVCDLNYWMADPPLLAAARSRGLATHDGLPMLVHQGVLAFERFTGITPDPAPVLARLRGLVAARR